MIEFQQISKQFRRGFSRTAQGFRALDSVDFTIKAGEFFSIVGPSGCGKSTLLNILAGLERSDSGSVLLDNVAISRPGPDRAVVFQQAGLMPWLTARQNVEYGLKLKGIGAKQRRDLAMHYLHMVHLASYAEFHPHQLSGGMQQRVAIARALALEPRVLLMDEPFSALDAQTRDMLHEELQRIWQTTRTTVVFVTHNLSEAVYLSDRILIMTASPGRIKEIVRVPFAHPRFKSSPELNAFVASLHSLIAEEVNKAAAAEFDADWLPVATKAGQPVLGTGEGI